MNAEPPHPRPPHLLAPSEVDAWLADSVVKTVTYHRTSALAAQSILRSGVRIVWPRGAAFGLGFYTATAVDEFYGDTTLTVAMRLLSPLVGPMADVEELVDRLHRRVRPTDRGLTAEGAVAVRVELLRLGYDGLVVKDAGGDGVDFVIALEADAVKVVVP